MKKYIILLTISLLVCGIIRAEWADSISLKIVMSTDPFYKKSMLVIQNNHSSSLSILFNFNYSRVGDKGHNEYLSNDKHDTYLRLKTLNLVSNQEEMVDYPLTLDKSYTSLFKMAYIKPDSIFKIPVELIYANIDNTKYKILDLYIKLVYLTDADMLSRKVEGFHIKEFRDIEFDIHHPTTPCCTPAPIPVPDQRVSAAINDRLRLLDSLQPPHCMPMEYEYKYPDNFADESRAGITEIRKGFQCDGYSDDTVFYHNGQLYRGSYTKAIGENPNIKRDGPTSDSVSLNMLLDLAKNSFLTHSVMMKSSFEVKDYITYPNGQPKTWFHESCTSIRQRGIIWSSSDGMYRDFIETIPLSPYGWYKFKGPSGNSLFQLLMARGIGWEIEDGFFVAYDGSILHLCPNRKMMVNEFNSKWFISDVVFDVLDSKAARSLLYPPENQRDSLYLKWGFIAGSILLDEFLDCFYRLYDEGSHFSKDDAYNAAFAYILERRGLELYRRAPGEADFKRYTTVPITDGQGRITGFRSTIWQ